MSLLNEKGILDYTGASLSWICAVHCIVMPFAIAFLPLLGLSFLADEKTEWLIIGFSVIVALLSLLPGYFYQHKKFRALLLFGTGIGIITITHLTLGENTVWKLPLILSGAIFITVAHFINRRLCRSCRLCCSKKSANCG